MQSVNAADKPLDHRVIEFLSVKRLGLSGFLILAQQDTLTAPVAAVSGLRSGGGCGLPVPGDVGLAEGRVGRLACYLSRSASSRARPTAWFREETPSFR